MRSDARESKPPGAFSWEEPVLVIPASVAVRIAGLPGFDRMRVAARGTESYWPLQAIYRAALIRTIPHDGSARGSNQGSSPEWITTEQAAQLLGITTRAVRQMLAGGRLKGYRDGRTWHIDPQHAAMVAAGRTT